MKAKIRNFTSTDLNEVRLLINTQNTLVLYPPYTYWLISRYFNESSFVVECNGEITGYIAALPIGDKNILFVWHYIFSAKPGRPVSGRDLLNKIIDFAVASGYKHLQCTMRADNIKGFNSMSRTLTRRGLELQTIGSESIYDFASNETINFNLYQCDLRCQWIASIGPLENNPKEGKAA